jgi:creatinine amidohydrolase
MSSVEMQFMRPAQLEAKAREFPVVYVPFGLIEWHGKHLPLGTDALKAHCMLIKVAEKFGGVVYPPIYFSSGGLQGVGACPLVQVLSNFFNALKKTGFRVIIGVSGHNTYEQIDMINQALKPVIADGTITGIGTWEYSFSECEESGSDHAAKWETSDMMYFYPDLVDLSALGNGPLAPDMKPPDGISGLDPRKYASVEVGRRNVELITDAIGKKARELLESLPKEYQKFGLNAVSKENWKYNC